MKLCIIIDDYYCYQLMQEILDSPTTIKKEFEIEDTKVDFSLLEELKIHTLQFYENKNNKYYLKKLRSDSYNVVKLHQIKTSINLKKLDA